MFDRTRWTLLPLMLPAALLIGALAVWPILRVLALSFFDADYGLADARFIGLENYRDALSHRFFRRSIANTLVFTLAASIIEVALGLGLALLVHRQFPGRRLVLPLLIFPLVLSTMVVSAIWRSWYHYDLGYLNTLLAAAGLHPVRWLASPDLALWSIVLVDVWQYTPLAFLILLAGLQAIPASLYEAARLDGAAPWRLFRDITLPLIAGHLALALLLRTVDTFKLFDKVYAMTGGGPGIATETMSLYVQEHAFRFNEMGLASAAAAIMLLISGALAALYAWRMLRR
jgi:multiple sugar transport system permease protein